MSRSSPVSHAPLDQSVLTPPFTPQATYFDRDDVAFPGFHEYFKKQSDEEREHAQKLIKFQNQRGGRVVMQPIMKPAMDEWGSPMAALQAALELEKSVNQSLLDLHRLADSRTDPQMCDFIENEFLTEQVDEVLIGVTDVIRRRYYPKHPDPFAAFFYPKHANDLFLTAHLIAQHTPPALVTCHK